MQALVHRWRKYFLKRQMCQDFRSIGFRIKTTLLLLEIDLMAVILRNVTRYYYVSFQRFQY